MPGQKSGPNIRSTNTNKIYKKKNKQIYSDKLKAHGGPSTIDFREARRIELAKKKEKREMKKAEKKAALKALKASG